MMIGANVPEEQVNSIADRTMREADKDGDGCITFAEFCHVSTSVQYTELSEWKISDRIWAD
ncbi:unnamed protein product [Nippostrongylus brasiliensis]|uniref:EF-hand domain-containing protein n=1 Tax=Nippostrongylus brasiliensis TaxID=27835 RepID=A0A0N4YC96_NIPBR|nr:unnamed protein product [Nippostrongylus brasiliensis]